MKNFLEKNYKKIVFIVMSLFLFVSLLNANNDSATYDEVAHIPAGYSYLTEHDTRLNPEHPPLIKDLAALPLMFMDLNFDTSQKFWTGELPGKWDEGQWVAGRHLLYQAGNDFNSIIFWSRVPMVLLSVFLGIFLFKWGRELAGILGGLGILILYAFDPNILGHNHFVTTDLGIAAFMTFSFYYFLKFIKNPSWKNTAIAGIFLGLLLVTKFSSIVAVPVYGLVIFIYPLFRKLRDKSGIEINGFTKRLSVIGEYLGKGIIALGFATIVIWSVYAFNTYEMPKETFTETVEFFFPYSDPNIKTIYTYKTLHALNESSITRPIGAYLFGPSWMFKRVSGGNGAYFLGEVGNGFTWYFPIVFVIKETLPFLILALLALTYSLKRFFYQFSDSGLNWKKTKERLLTFIRSSVLEYTLFTFIVLYSYLSISGGLNIGFRHLFPIMTFSYILIVKKIYEMMKRTHNKTAHSFGVIILLLALWQITTSVMAYPSFTSYFNESVGGSKKGYNYVTDSNTDWGQDLKRLNVWISDYNHCATKEGVIGDIFKTCNKIISSSKPINIGPIEKIHVDYFGGGDIYQTIGEKRTILWWDSKRPVENGWYAISTNFLQGSIYDSRKSADSNYSWTLNYKPVAQIGASILIFHVTDL